MALVANNETVGKKKANYEPLKAGTYPARIVQIIDMGVQPQRAYQGKEKPPVQEVGITYELVDEFLKDEEGNEMEDRPRWISESFPLFSLNADRAKSTQRYKALDPEETYQGDFSQLVGLPCSVTIVTNEKGDKVYNNVAGISSMRPRDAAKCPDLVNEPKVFDLDDPDVEVFRSLPEWLQEKIKSNLNYGGSKLEGVLKGEQPKKKEEKQEEAPQDSEEAPYDDDAPW